MYTQWLYFFNSPLKEVSIKGQKQKQPVIKEWLDDGSMKISGNKPSNWSIIIQTILTTDISTLQYNIQNDEIKAKHLFQRAFKDRNKQLFNEAENLYIISEKNKKDLITLKEENDILLKNIQEKIFQNKRNLYLINLKKPVDLNKVKKISSELKESIIEHMNILKGIEERENNYIFKPQSILRSGPTPDPPDVKALTIKIGREKNIDISQQSISSDNDDIKYIKGLKSNDIDNVKNKNNKNNELIVNSNNKNNELIVKAKNENVKGGGYIKVIKL